MIFYPLSLALILTFNSSVRFYVFHSPHKFLLLREAAVEDAVGQQVPLLSLPSTWADVFYVKSGFCMSASTRSADIREQPIIPGRAAGKCPQGIPEGLETRTRMKLCSSSHKHAHHADKIKVFTTANASQGAQQVGPVLSLQASSLGGCKGLLGKQTRQATTFAASKTHASAVPSWGVYHQTRSASVLASFALRDGASASWLRAVTPLAPTYLGLGTSSASPRAPRRWERGQRPRQVWLLSHSDVFQSERLVLWLSPHYIWYNTTCSWCNTTRELFQVMWFLLWRMWEKALR